MRLATWGRKGRQACLTSVCPSPYLRRLSHARMYMYIWLQTSARPPAERQQQQARQPQQAHQQRPPASSTCCRPWNPLEAAPLPRPAAVQAPLPRQPWQLRQQAGSEQTRLPVQLGRPLPLLPSPSRRLAMCGSGSASCAWHTRGFCMRTRTSRYAPARIFTAIACGLTGASSLVFCHVYLGQSSAGLHGFVRAWVGGC